MTKSSIPVITDPQIHDYCLAHSSQPPAGLRKITEATKVTGKTIMLSGEYLGQYLRMMSMILKPKYVLEFGTFTGYGALCLIEGLQEGGQIYTLEKDPTHAKMAAQHFHDFGATDQITLLTGDAMEAIAEINHPWDLVFIDAAKRQYIKYYEYVLPLMPSGGVILADNVLWKGIVATDNLDKLGEGLHAFNEHVFQDDRVENMILPIDDGVHFIVKK